MKNSNLVFSFVSVTTTVLLLGCGGGGSTNSIASNAYQGSGSTWSITSKSDGTCTLTEKDSNLNVYATCSTLSSGFTKIVVNSSTGGNSSLAAPATNAVTYAFEIAGYMMPFMAFGENKVVPTVLAGNCTPSLNHNYVVSFANLGTLTDYTGWSLMGNYSLTNGRFIANRFKADGTAMQGWDEQRNISCNNNGIFEDNDPSGSFVRLYFTKDGGAIFYRDSTKTSPAQDGLSTENDFMLPIGNDITTLTQLDGNYIGFVATSQGAGNYSTAPVRAGVVNGAFTINSLSGAELVTSNSHSSFSLNATKVASGLYKGSLTHINSGGSIGCAINANIGSQKTVICSGIDPSDNTNKTLYSVILRSI